MNRSPMKPGKGFKPRTVPMMTAKRKEGKVAAKPKRRTTAAEHAHLSAVAALGCILCQHLGFGPEAIGNGYAEVKADRPTAQGAVDL